MPTTDRESYVLHLAQAAFDADMKHMTELKRTSPDDYLGWDYHIGARTPLVERYRAIALAVEKAIYADMRTIFGRQGYFEPGADDKVETAWEALHRAT